MDDGYVIQGLGDGWSFAGAKIHEWAYGVATFIIVSVFVPNIARSMPLILIFTVGVPLLFAFIRSQFPDEEKGLMNWLVEQTGFVPPGMPAPAVFQPQWSGAPLRTLSKNSQYKQLNLDVLFERQAGEEDAEG